MIGDTKGWFFEVRWMFYSTKFAIISTFLSFCRNLHSTQCRWLILIWLQGAEQEQIPGDRGTDFRRFGIFRNAQTEKEQHLAADGWRFLANNCHRDTVSSSTGFLLHKLNTYQDLLKHGHVDRGNYSARAKCQTGTESVYKHKYMWKYNWCLR